MNKEPLPGQAHYLWCFLIVLLIVPLSMYAQRPISGKVVDGSNLPLAGANMVEEGTLNGVVTDFDGNFEITLQDPGHALLFSYLGFTGQRLLAPDGFMTVVLQGDVAHLEEVVIIGYGQTKQKDLTGSVATVRLDDLQSRPSSNIGDAIQGKAAGVTVITSGQPGNNPIFRIRGTGTIGNNDPLIVVDGMPLNGGLNQVNMKDVESLSVLKDASATAIYGSRGSNGVIIITTKRGKQGKGSLEIDTFTGFQQPTHVIDLLNAAEFARLSNEMLTNGGMLPNPAFADPEALGKGTDWLDAFLGSGQMGNLTLSYTQGNERSSVYTSLNYFDQQGVVINSAYKRYIAQFNADSKINDHIKFGSSIKLNYDIKENGDNSMQNAILSLPTQPIFRENGMYSGPRGQALHAGDVENPIGKSNIVENSIKGYNLQGNIFGELSFLGDFRFKTLFGVETNFWDSRTWAPAYSWDSDLSPNAYLGEASHKSLTMIWDNTLTYSKEFKDGSSITAVIGTGAQENTYKFISGSVQGFSSESTQTLNNGLLQPTIDGTGSQWAILSYFARGQFDFRNKYYLTATVRRDGSSRFGEGNKFGTFPSASLAWRISQEKFLQG